MNKYSFGDGISEKMLGGILDSMSAQLAVIDRDATIIAVNKSWLESGGSSGKSERNEKTGVGANYLEVCKKSAAVEPTVADVAEGIKQILEGNRDIFTFEYPCHYLSERKWFLMSVTPLSDENGGAVISHTDITERKLAAERLREEKRRFQALTEVSPAATLVSTGNKITFANDACTRLFGADSPDQIIGKSIFDFIEPDFFSEIKNRASQIGKTQKTAVPLDLKIVRLDGDSVEAESLGSSFLEAEREAVLVVLRDVSERKQAEARRRRSYEIFFDLVRNAPFGIFILDGEFRLRTVSAGAEKVFAQVKPFIGRDFAEIIDRLWTEPFASATTERFRNTLATGETYQAKDMSEQRNDIPGVESYDWKIERITLPDEKFGVACYFYDLTERREAEAILRKSEEQLRIFIEQSPASVAMLDCDMNFLAVSRSWLQDYQIKEEIVGKSHYQIFPSISDDWRKIHRKCMTGAVEKNDEDEFERPDGSRAWLKWEARPWFDRQGKPSGIVIFTQDITARKNIERQLRLYEKVIINARDAVLITEAEPVEFPGPRIVYVNPAFTMMTGYAPEEIIGQTPRILQGEKTNRAELDKIHRALKKWQPSRASLTNYRKDGSEFEVDFDVFPIADKNNVFTHWVSIQRDISEQQRLTADLSLSEEKYRLLFEKNPLPINIIDQDTLQFLEVNEAAVKLYGYSREEFQQKKLSEIIFPEDLSKFEKAFENGKKTDAIFSFPVRHRKKNGEAIDVEVSRYRIDFENRPAHLRIIQDVTERNKAANLIREKNQLLEQTYDAIFVWNLTNGISYWNPNAQRLYGFTESEAGGRDPYDLLKSVSPQPREEFIEYLREQGIWEGELVQQTKSGAEVYVEARLYVIERDGQNLTVLETVRDVTERRRLEAKIAHAGQLALIGELAAGLAHEIKNPLAGIKGVIDILLRRRASNGDVSREHEILKSVSFEIERIDKTVRALLQHSRPKPLEISSAPLDETIRRAVQIALHRADKRSSSEVINIEFKAPRTKLMFSHDAAKLEDVVLNLLLNAAESIGDQKNGKITVVLKKHKLPNNGAEVRIEIKDNGCGIAPDKLEKIFTPFQTTKTEGTGLGLASVRRIVRAHGGECVVRSKTGKGSTFTIKLPLACSGNKEIQLPA